MTLATRRAPWLSLEAELETEPRYKVHEAQKDSLKFTAQWLVIVYEIAYVHLYWTHTHTHTHTHTVVVITMY